MLKNLLNWPYDTGSHSAYKYKINQRSAIIFNRMRHNMSHSLKGFCDRAIKKNGQVISDVQINSFKLNGIFHFYQ